MKLSPHPYGKQYFHIPTKQKVWLSNQYSNGSYFAHTDFIDRGLIVKAEDLREVNRTGNKNGRIKINPMKTTDKLPEDFKKKLIAALRGGEYKQGSGWLHLDGEFCCLGVAYHIATGHLPPEGFFYVPEKNEYPDVITDGVPDLLIGTKGAPNELACMNDGNGKYYENEKSFSEIADWIQENL